MSVRAANAVAVIGSIVCVLFFCLSVRGEKRDVFYPPESSGEAVSAFLSEHTALADALGLDVYFPEESILVGAFSNRGEEAYHSFREEAKKEWTFREYLRDAFRALMGQH